MSADRYLTILLTLKNRSSFTFRWLAYANANSLPFRVLIADGSSDDVSANALRDHSRYPRLDYHYVRYPYDLSFVEYYAKVTNALDLIQTPFVALADNDDFPVVSGLRRSVEFLQSHPDYSACRGKVGALRIHESNGDRDLSGVYGDEIVFFPDVYENCSLDDQTAGERLRLHFQKYGPTWYEVHHTAQLREAFGVLREQSISDLYLAELLISGLTVVAGKVRRESYPYLIRQTHTPDSGYARKHDLMDRMLLETWSADFKKFVAAMAHALTSAEGMPVAEAEESVKEIYRSYVESSLSHRFTTNKINQSESSDRNFSWLGKSLRNLYLLANNASGGQLRKARMQFVTSVFDDEFKLIKEFLAAGPKDASGLMN
jgi:glycosyltransferase domain-containing protein